MKKKMIGLFCFVATGVLCFALCKKYVFTTDGASEPPCEYFSEDCTCPHYRLHLQPYGDFTKEEAARIVDDLKKNMPILFDEQGLEVTILDPQPMPSMAYSKTYGRYRADSLLTYENRLKQEGIKLMGLTHKDISTTIHGQKDRGIIGYSLCPGQSSIVSTYRISNRANTWKTVAHEFIHTLGVPHCPNDDPACIMRDAKGKAPKYAQKKGLCHDCASKAGIPIYDPKVKYIK